VDDALDFMRSQHYAPAALRSRLFHLLDPPATLRISGDDTIPLAFTGLGRHRPVPVVALAAFVRARPRFLLLSRSSYKHSWIVPRLLEHRGLDVRLLAREGDLVAYLVSRR
jgi:hypothetical protein